MASTSLFSLSREGRLRQLAGPDEIHGLPDVLIHPAVAIEERHAGAHQSSGRSRPRARFLYTAQVEGLADGEEMDRRDVLRELDHAASVAGSYCSHAHLVLVVRLG